MTSVAELSITFVKLPLIEGAEVHHERERRFSSLARAEEWMRSHLNDPFEYPDFSKDVQVLHYTILVGKLDGPWEPDCVRYDGRGEVFDDSRTASDPWPGRPPETCRFAVGDAVLCAAYRGRGPARYITRGIVKSRPIAPGQYPNLTLERSDDIYLVLFPEISEDAHEHPHDCQMWRVEDAG